MKTRLDKGYQVHDSHGINDSIIDQWRIGINIGIRSVMDVFSQLLFNMRHKTSKSPMLITQLSGRLFPFNDAAMKSIVHRLMKKAFSGCPDTSNSVKHT